MTELNKKYMESKMKRFYKLLEDGLIMKFQKNDWIAGFRSHIQIEANRKINNGEYTLGKQMLEALKQNDEWSGITPKNFCDSLKESGGKSEL